MKITASENQSLKQKKSSWSERFIRKLRKSQVGAGVVEYILIALVICIVVGPAFYFLGGRIADRIHWIAIGIQDGWDTANEWLANRRRPPQVNDQPAPNGVVQ